MCTCKLHFTHIVRRDPECTLHGDRVQPDLFNNNSPTKPLDDFFTALDDFSTALDDFSAALTRIQSFRDPHGKLPGMIPATTADTLSAQT